MNTTEPAPSAPEAARTGWDDRDAMLADALTRILKDLDAVAVAAYMRVPGAPFLDASVVAVTPTGVGAVERVPVGDDAYPSARAYGTGEIVTESSLQVQAERPGLSVFMPYAYTILAVPLISGDHTFGTLSTYWLRSDTRAGRGATDSLAGRAAAISTRLARLADAGVSLTPPPVPLVVAAAGDKSPEAQAAPAVFHLSKLAVLLASARSTSDVVDLVVKRLMYGLGTSASTLTLVSAEQLRVVGASGCAREYVHLLDGASLLSGVPEATVARTQRRATYAPADPATRGRCAGSGRGDGLTWVVVPLVTDGHALGTCSMGFDATDRTIAGEPSVLTALSALIGQALDRTLLHDAQHALAENFQSALLPRVLPQVAGVVSTSRYLPATSGIEVGGDWYDLIDLPDGGVTMVIGDVQGHNTAAAAVMGQLRSVVRAYASEGHGAAAVLERTNRLLVRLNTDLFATCCCMTLDPDTGVARVATAGHPLPLIRTGQGAYRTVDPEPGIPLGIDADADYQEVELTLRPGTFLLFYTDGLTHPAHTFPPRRLEAALAATGGEVEALADRLIADSRTSATRLADDAALQLVHYEGPSAAARSNVRQLEIHRRDLQGAQRARVLLRQWLTEWQLASIADEAELLVSEVVTNGLVHGDSDVFLCARRYPGTIRVEVRDSDPRPAHTVAVPGMEDEAEGGRGLLIVSALADTWGNSPGGRGKTVWFELPTPSRASAS